MNTTSKPEGVSLSWKITDRRIFLEDSNCFCLEWVEPHIKDFQKHIRNELCLKDATSPSAFRHRSQQNNLHVQMPQKDNT